jgi:hypothetical protein
MRGQLGALCAARIDRRADLQLGAPARDAIHVPACAGRARRAHPVHQAVDDRVGRVHPRRGRRRRCPR